MTLRNYYLVFLLFVLGCSLTAQSVLWKDVTIDDQYKSAGPVLKNKVPKAARTISLDKENMQNLLWQATYPEAKAKGTKVQIPTNMGEFETFEVFRKANVFAENLVDKYGETIRAFTGHKVDDPTSVIHMTMGYGMFNAVTYRTGGVLDYVEYASVLKDGTYLAYRRGEAVFDKVVCAVDDKLSKLMPLDPEDKSVTPSEQYNFRLQLTTSGSFSQQFGDGTPTKAEIQAVITGQINNILNPIYNRDFGVILLNATHDNTIFLTTGANTPFSDETNSLAILYENGVFCNDGQASAIAGVSKGNYDVGHAQVFENSGGVAASMSVCDEFTETAPAGNSVTGQAAVTKAQGMSGISYPLLNDFTVDYVAHELGHQFGCNHTYATVEGPMGGCNTGSATSRYEVGSGTTIMAYVNVCSDEMVYPDGLVRSDPFFHSHSIDEALTSIAGFGCKFTTTAANAADPVATPSAASFSIPMGTPFALVGTVTDGEGSPLAAWNQFDLAVNTYDGGNLSSMSPTTSGPPLATNTSGPLFRFAVPAAPAAGDKVTRILPNNGLTKGTQAWEVLPTVARSLNFRLLARDNQSGAGSFGRTTIGTTSITVTNDGPLAISAPAMGAMTNQGANLTVTYSGLPVGICSEVDVFLSTDGGATYLPTALATNLSNSGTQSVTIPVSAPLTTNARILLQCHTTDGTLLGSSTPFQVSDIFSIEAALPVDLLSIRADAEGKTNVITWTTANEEGVEGFDVQRSTNGTNWNTLGFEEGRNLFTAQNYHWIDQEPLSGINYYRLNSRDLDGATELSQVVFVTRGADGLGLNILPNPAQDQFEVNVNGVDFSTASPVNIQVYSAAGQLVYEQQMNDSRLRVDASVLASGVYFVRLTHGGLTASRKLLVL